MSGDLRVTLAHTSALLRLAQTKLTKPQPLGCHSVVNRHLADRIAACLTPRQEFEQ